MTVHTSLPVANPTKPITHCQVCKYELTDQPVEFIPEFHFNSVRCPECGQQQPAGITTQPWRYRKLKFSLMLTLWVLLLFLSIFSVTNTLTSMVQTTTHNTLKPFAHHISALQAYSDPKYDRSLAFGGDLNPLHEINEHWWNDLGQKIARESFDPSSHINWIAFTNWLWFLLIAPAIALLYYALLFRAHRITKAITAVISLLLAAYLTDLSAINNYTFYRFTPEQAAMSVAAAPIAWSTFAVGSLSIIIAYTLMPRLINALRKPFGNIPTEPIAPEHIK